VVTSYSWAATSTFVGRTAELEQLEAWWGATTTSGINLFGRRRVGKSWLFRRFAHGKPAVILVAAEGTPAQQLTQLAEELEPHLGVRPAITSLDTLFQAIFQLGRDQQVLVVLDELPYLLGTTETAKLRNLSLIQAAIEKYQAGSRTRLLICGSAVAQMEHLQVERSPLHGRFQPLELRSMPFAEARLMMDPALTTEDRFTRFAIAGGMPPYLELLGKGPLDTTIATTVANRLAPFFDAPATALATELREVGTYMSILDALAESPADSQGLQTWTGLDATALPPYLARLEALRVVRQRRPVGALPGARVTHWECCDHFFRFWFRFVRRYQADLLAGADPRAHVREHVMPNLAHHTSLVFEEEVRRWARQQYPEASRLGAWWGRALDSERAAGTRTSEEVDVVGLANQNVVLLGEVKWENRKTSAKVLSDLLTFKLPAIKQAKFKTPVAPRLVICSRSGFTDSLVRMSEEREDVDLVPARVVLGP
jgi:AAA+ ATPase superfamily predicted ATPase